MALQLQQVEDAIEALVTGGLTQYSVNGQTFTKLQLPSLMELRDKLRREQGPDGQGRRLFRQMRVLR